MAELSIRECFNVGTCRIFRKSIVASFGFALAAVLEGGEEQTSASRGEMAQWEIGAGVVESWENKTFAMVFTRYHFPWEWHGVRLWTEASVFDGGAFWLGGGIRYDIRLGNEWRICLASGPGYFHESDDLDLGHELEFYSSIELVRKIGRSSSVVAGIGHLSNAGFGDFNPGANTLRLSYRWEIRTPDIQ